MLSGSSEFGIFFFLSGRITLISIHGCLILRFAPASSGQLTIRASVTCHHCEGWRLRAPFKCSNVAIVDLKWGIIWMDHMFASTPQELEEPKGAGGWSQKAPLINLSVQQSPQKTHTYTITLPSFAWASENRSCLLFLSRSSIVSLRIKGGAFAASTTTTTKTTPRCTEEQPLILQCEFQTASHQR